MTKAPSEMFRDDPWHARDVDELRRLLDRAVAASVNGIVITDPTLPDNPIIYANPAFERTTGYRVEDALGRNCRFLQGDDRDQPQVRELREAIEEGREVRTVLRNYRKDGTRFWNELYISPVHDDEGRLTNFIGVQNDITSRKKAEEERDLLLAREQLARAEAVKARRRLALLADAGARLSSTLDYAATVEQLPHLAVPELADFCVVDILEEDGLIGRTVVAHAEAEREPLLRELERCRAPEGVAPGIVKRVLQSGQPVLQEEVTDELLQEHAADRRHLEILRELEVRSWICVPLRARGRTFGVMTLASSDPHYRYGESELSLVEDLARRCALALDNARLYRERSNIAHTLQQSLLPRLSEPEGIEVGVQYLPLGEENEVGGDFYDLIEIKDGWLAVIGDVVGKGAAAAAVTALARYTIRAVALQEYSPSSILSALNDAMHTQLRDHQFCTVSCARLRLVGSGAVLTVSRAGHPPPLLLRADGTLEGLTPSGKFLGVVSDPNLGEQAEYLEPGDTAIFYTDGLTEARSPDGSVFGEERLRELVRSCRGLSAPETARRLREVALNYGEGNPRDDLAVLVLRLPPQ
jgi:PAS domain S-box-containing protein